MHVSAIIAAGGRGLRFGAAQPKQFLTLGGRSILERSVDAFLTCDVIDDLVVALPARPGRGAAGISAGSAASRSRSSMADAPSAGFGRERVRARRRAGGIVVIHDAARPLVTDQIDPANRCRCGAVRRRDRRRRAHDTVKRASADGIVTATLPREEIYLAQTPQAFRARCCATRWRSRGDATDEAMLAEQAGHPSRSWRAIRAI